MRVRSSVTKYYVIFLSVTINCIIVLAEKLTTSDIRRYHEQAPVVQTTRDILMIMLLYEPNARFFFYYRRYTSKSYFLTLLIPLRSTNLYD